MNSKYIGTSDPHRLLLNHSHKIDLKEVIDVLVFQTFVFSIHAKI